MYAPRMAALLLLCLIFKFFGSLTTQNGFYPLQITSKCLRKKPLATLQRRRAGTLLRAKEITQRYNISQVQARQVNHVKTETDFRGHNPANCVFIATKKCRPKATEGQSKQFVPSLLLSNVMSLSPKMDKLSHVVQNANYDLVCITETWGDARCTKSIYALLSRSIV